MGKENERKKSVRKMMASRDMIHIVAVPRWQRQMPDECVGAIRPVAIEQTHEIALLSHIHHDWIRLSILDNMSRLNARLNRILHLEPLCAKMIDYSDDIPNLPIKV
jgi:hypothetical protein